MKYLFLIIPFLLSLINPVHAWQYRVEVIVYPIDKTSSDKAITDLNSYTTLNNADISLLNILESADKTNDAQIVYNKIRQEIVFKSDAEALEYYQDCKTLMNENGGVKIHKCKHVEYGEIKNTPCAYEEETVLVKK